MGDRLLRYSRVGPQTAMDPLLAHLDWLRLRGLREVTIRQRAYAVHRAERVLGPLLEATEAQMKEWRASLDHLAPVTVSMEIMHVNRYLEWALDEGLIEANPARRLVRPRKPRMVPRPMSIEDLTLALTHAPQPIHAQLVLAAFAGLRVGEIARLQRCDVLDTARPPVIFVRDGKGGTQRVIPMGETVLTALKDCGLPVRGFVFARRDGKPGGNTPNLMSKTLNNFLRSVGVLATAHQARHAFGTRLHQVSHDARLVAGVMGHASLSTVLGYIAWSNDDAVRAVRALDTVAALAV